MNETNESGMGEVIRIDEARIRDHLGEMVRGTVEEALNAMLDAEADRVKAESATSAAKVVATGAPRASGGAEEAVEWAWMGAAAGGRATGSAGIIPLAVERAEENACLCSPNRG